MSLISFKNLMTPLSTDDVPSGIYNFEYLSLLVQWGERCNSPFPGSLAGGKVSS